jgi:hypothetical protein
MKNPKLALKYFVLAYLIATVVGFVTYRIHELLMWIVMFTFMPVVFGYFFYSYLKKTQCPESTLFRETNILIACWIVASFLLDGLVYIVVIPVIFGRRPHWTFFIEQSPWIWLNYCTLAVLGHVSRWAVKRRLNKAA